MYFCFDFMIDKLENSIGFNLYLKSRVYRFVKLIKRFQFKQNKEFLKIIEDFECNKDKLISFDEFEKEMGFSKYVESGKPKTYISFQFDYLNLIFPWFYNWIVFRFFEFLKDENTFSFTILGVGITIERY